MCYDLEQMEKKAAKRSDYENKRRGITPSSSGNDSGGGGGDSEASQDYYRASGFDHPFLLIISCEKSDRVQRYHWGLIPHWVKTVEKANEIVNMTLNATCETIFEKPSFRNIIMKKRALLPVEGFYEHHHLGKNKYPYFIHMKDKETFYLGCVYDEWKNPETGEIVHSFSVVTTPANELCTKIHNTKLRMPYIVPQADVDAWLDLNTSQEQLKAMMRPYPSELMDAHTVARPLKNTPNSKDFFEYPELGMFD